MTETTTTGTTGTGTRIGRTVWPCLSYRDAPAAMDFLRNAFGCTELARYDEGGIVQHAEMALPGGGGIMLGTTRAEGECPPAGGSVYVVIDNPDELYERARAAGATVTRELRDEDYGSRGFTCRDPEGVSWSFGTYAGAQDHA